MTTTQQGWPTQIRLPGQTAAPEGPVDIMSMYVMHHAITAVAVLVHLLILQR